MNSFTLLILSLLVSVPSFAGSVFSGKWATSSGATTYYADDQTVAYQNCTVNFELTNTATSIQIKTLKTACKSDHYWDFDQELRAHDFKLSRTGVLTLPDGTSAGTMTATSLSLKYDEDGTVVFLKADVSNGTVVIDWSMRSFDDLNYDVKATAQKI